MGQSMSLKMKNFTTAQFSRRTSAYHPKLFWSTHIFTILSGGIPDAHPLPCCWDELLDWCHHATIMMEFLRHQLLSEESSCESEEGRNENEESRNEEKSGLYSHRQPSLGNLGQFCDLRFVPFISHDSLDNKFLPSMTWIQRSAFYVENVIIIVYEKQIQEEWPICFLHISQFVSMTQLASRLLDILVLKRTMEQNESLVSTKKTTLLGEEDEKECLICRDANISSILSCGHSLCGNCEQRWVLKHLVCPFCRYKFRNTREVCATGWEITEFTRDDLKFDLHDLQKQLSKFWDELLPGDGTPHLEEELLRTCYHELPRNLVVNEEDGFLVIEKVDLSN